MYMTLVVHSCGRGKSVPISQYVKDIRAKIGKDLLILAGSSAVVIKDDNEVLLQLRSDFPIWSLPGGDLDPGEDVAACVIREVYEEAGIYVRPEHIVAVLSGPGHVHVCANGDQVASVQICFRCRPCDETPPKVNDDESLEVRYFSSDALPANTYPPHRMLIAKALENNPSAYFYPPSA